MYDANEYIKRYNRHPYRDAINAWIDSAQTSELLKGISASEEEKAMQESEDKGEQIRPKQYQCLHDFCVDHAALFMCESGTSPAESTTFGPFGVKYCTVDNKTVTQNGEPAPLIYFYCVIYVMYDSRNAITSNAAKKDALCKVLRECFADKFEEFLGVIKENQEPISITENMTDDGGTSLEKDTHQCLQDSLRHENDTLSTKSEEKIVADKSDQANEFSRYICRGDKVKVVMDWLHRAIDVQTQPKWQIAPIKAAMECKPRALYNNLTFEVFKKEFGKKLSKSSWGHWIHGHHDYAYKEEDLKDYKEELQELMK